MRIGMSEEIIGFPRRSSRVREGDNSTIGCWGREVNSLNDKSSRRRFVSWEIDEESWEISLREIESEVRRVRLNKDSGREEILFAPISRTERFTNISISGGIEEMLLSDKLRILSEEREASNAPNGISDSLFPDIDSVSK